MYRRTDGRTDRQTAELIRVELGNLFGSSRLMIISLQADRGSPGRNYVVLMRMVLQIIQYDTLHSVWNDTSKKGGDTPRATD
jgi:hypothetical protein